MSVESRKDHPISANPLDIKNAAELQSLSPKQGTVFHDRHGEIFALQHELWYRTGSRYGWVPEELRYPLAIIHIPKKETND